MAGSLEFIKQVTTSSTSTASVTDVFTSSYDVYAISFDWIKQTSGNVNLRLIDSGGSVISDSEYDLAYLNLASYNTFFEYKQTNQTSFPELFFASTTVGGGVMAYIFNPNDSSSYTFLQAQHSGYYDGAGGGGQGRKIIGVHKVAEQITGLQLVCGSGTISATINVYGVK
tara:strand:- start:434 stop:943 length:510 start_codon:yes stop_codon:yes gene_type:complete